MDEGSEQKEVVPKKDWSFLYTPKQGEKFLKHEVEDKVNEILQQQFESTPTYDPKTATNITKELCTKILDKVRHLGYKRYKFVVQVVVTSSSGQGLRVASRCLWDKNQDNYVSGTFKNVL